MPCSPWVRALVLVRLPDSAMPSLPRANAVPPIAAVLNSQVQDARDHARRELLEIGGKREIAMMIPVVFLILPVTVLFTLYPGLQALTFMT